MPTNTPNQGGTPRDEGRGPNPAAVAHALRGVDFPKTKNELIEHARGSDAEQSQDVVGTLERIPDREYRSMSDVEAGVGRRK